MGDEARDESFAGGVEDGIGSRGVGGGGWSRLCMRLEKNPEIRFDARVCCSQRWIMVLVLGHLHPSLRDAGFFDPAKMR